MGYHQKGSLAALFGTQARQATRRAQHDVAGAAGRRMTQATRAATPVDTGRTRDSFEEIPVHPDGPDAFTSGVESDYYKARFAEYGTARHDVRGKDAREAGGEPVERPAVPGHHMVARAAAQVEAELDELARPHLRAMAAEIENLAENRAE